MTLDELLSRLTGLPVRIRRDGDDLVVRAPEGTLDAELLRELRAHKAALLDRLARGDTGWWSPPPRLTPRLLPLVDLTQEQLDRVVASVPGGAANVQDVYPLGPLQEGIFFHHLMGGDGDPYLGWGMLAADSRADVDRFVTALRAVVDRHDILRTALAWEGLPQPVQVVLRHAEPTVDEVTLDTGRDPVEQLRDRFDPAGFRMDLRTAPLLRVVTAYDERADRWLLLVLMHHLIGDNATWGVLQGEIAAVLAGRADALPRPVPYRDVVARAVLGTSRADHEEFFTGLLGDVDEPTAPYGLTDVHHSTATAERRLPLAPSLTRAVRERARRAGVSTASLFHLAWGTVLARLTGRSDVVFGTVLLGRTQGSAGSGVGLFINTLPIRVPVDATGTLDALRHTHELLAELLRHEHAPLVLAQGCSRVPAGLPLFTSLLNYRHTPSDPAATLGGLGVGVEVLHSEERTNYPLTVSVDDAGSAGLTVTAQVDHHLDPDRVCAHLVTALEELCHTLATDPAAPMADIDVLPAAERALITGEFNATARPDATDAPVHRAFEARAAAHPHAVAATDGHTQVTYRDLNAMANRVAHRLRSAGVGPDARVALCARRGVRLLAALLGVLKAGAAYVPLDPSYPAERLAFTLADARPAVVLVDGTAPDTDGVPVLDLATDFTTGPTDDPPHTVTPADAAYVIYTSGSTGVPKGVVVQHGSLTNFLLGMRDLVPLDAGDALLAVTTVAFDIAALELYLPLTSGARVVIADEGTTAAPAALIGLAHCADVTVLQATPSLWRMLTAHDPDGLRGLRMLVGGEALPAPLADQLRDLGRELLNVYGPTETTIWSTAAPLTDRDDTPIGRPLRNTAVYVVDGRGRPAPVGVVGELFIGGRGVARGYLGRPALTGERFVPDWLTGGGSRLYRTGDLVRRLPDGTLEFVGRDDFQVKVRGYRIELGEVEARLTEVDGVSEAVVVAREDRLDAYYVPAAPGVTPAALREALGAALPSYMVPSAFVALDALPLTPNKKVDRSALPAPGAGAVAASGYRPPVGVVEEVLAGIWADLLGVPGVGRDDDFFQLGGHSLLAVSLVERMRQAGLTCDVRAVFATPTVAGLAAAVAEGGGTEVPVPPNAIPAGAEAITPDMLPLVSLTEEQIAKAVASVPGGAANVQDIYPLAPLQEGIFFHHLMGGETDPYLLSYTLPVRTRDDADRFTAALQTVVDRHDILRTSIVWEGLPHPVQVVRRHAALPVDEVTLDGPDDAVRHLQTHRAPLDLQQAPLLRVVTAYDEPNDRWLLLVLMHHLVGDHTALAAMRTEVAAVLAGRADGLPDPVPYRNAVAQAVLGASRDEQEEFFTGLLGDIDEPTAPYGILDVRGDGSGITEAQVTADPDLAATVREQARRAGVSPASVFHVAWGLVLSRLTGRSDVVFGTVLFGRTQAGAGAERGLGLFINTLPLRLDVAERPVRDAVQDAQHLLADVLRHEHTPLVLAQGCSQVPAGTPLFTSLFNYRQSVPTPTPATSDAADGGFEVLHSQERTNYPVVVSVDDVGGSGFVVTAQVDERVDAGRVCALLVNAVRGVGRALEAGSGVSVGAVEVLPEAERALVVEGFNDTGTSVDARVCVHELFEARARVSPDAVAVVHGDVSVSYGELDRAANRVARRLRAEGVGPDVRVGICARRGIPLLAAMLGVLKAGGAYVPLDPSYPAERLAFMLADARPAVVLVDGTRLDAEGIPVLDLTTDFDDEPDVEVPWVGASSSLGVAYVMYTSGSTGVPKGVAVEHRNIVRLVVDNPAVVFEPGDRVAFAANPSFDAATWEVWGPLLNGGAVVVVEQDVVLDAGRFAEVLRARSVSVLWMTVGLFNQYHSVLREVLGQLRYLVVGGDVLDPTVMAAIVGGPEHVLNGYGPTESTTFAAMHRIESVEAGRSVPIGRPIGNTRIYLVDGRGRPVPVGAVGELFIGGLGVARGYLGRPGLTAERFVPDWLTGDGSRLYRTGDLGRWLPDGTIEFVGRNDHQVKVRGFRVELGEVEARLLELDGVREAVVVGRGDRLDAYYVPAGSDGSAAALREALGAVLPSYMVPSAFVALDALPLTPNGKVDRRALPVPDRGAVVAGGMCRPSVRSKRCWRESGRTSWAWSGSVATTTSSTWVGIRCWWSPWWSGCGRPG
ncbi:amino acid adenylation domain-containing protein [Streptomyces sp. G45]|uniref:amino acid adenylation domain-containing protein n=1 Tax=Streptomyces sp. G45 TaxID=3406627 RepID=UPI003C1DB331